MGVVDGGTIYVQCRFKERTSGTPSVVVVDLAIERGPEARGRMWMDVSKCGGDRRECCKWEATEG